jgi:hypothetical protein
MAQISALPQKVKELALENQRIDQIKWGKDVKQDTSEHLSSSFSWSETPEGNDFWNIMNNLY